MNVKQRFKLGAGAGLVTMLLGALMVLAPGVGAYHTTPIPTIYNTNVQCQGTGQGNVAGLGYDDSVEFGSGNSGDADGVSFESYLDENNVRHFTWESESHLVGAVIVKQANGAAVFSYEPEGAKEGTVYVGTGKDRSGISHISFCYGGEGTQPRTGAISVDKEVTGVVQPADTGYAFTVTCELDEVPVVLDDDSAAFSLTADDPVKTISGLPIGTECAVTETDSKGANTVIYEVGGEEVDGPAKVTVASGTTAIVVTNDYEPELTVRKLVTGPNAPPTWSFDFDCNETEQVQAAAVVVDEADPCSPFTLDNDPATESGAEKVFPAGVYDITELDDDNLTSIVCTDENGSVDGSTVFGVDVTESDVLCVFTNNFPGGGGGGFTPDPDPEPEPEPEQSLQVVKQVTGVDAPTEWDVTIDVVGEGDFAEVGAVDNVNPSALWDVEVGQYTMTETVAGDVVPTLVSLTCVDEDGNVPVTPTDGGGTVTIEEGADVSCTFVNEYPLVLSEVEEPTPTPEPEPEVVTPAAEVQGVQTVRALPRTGDETKGLAGIGALMLAMGAAMVLGSRRQLARR